MKKLRNHGGFQVIYQVRSCAEDNGLHRHTLPPISICSTVCAAVSTTFPVSITVSFFRFEGKGNNQSCSVTLIYPLPWMTAGSLGILHTITWQTTGTHFSAAQNRVRYKQLNSLY